MLGRRPGRLFDDLSKSTASVDVALRGLRYQSIRSIPLGALFGHGGSAIGSSVEASKESRDK